MQGKKIDVGLPGDKTIMRARLRRLLQPKNRWWLQENTLPEIQFALGGAVNISWLRGRLRDRGINYLREL